MVDDGEAEMYAVFRSGGKQYRAQEGDRIKLEKINADEGSNINFDEVMMLGEGSDVKVGSPFLPKISVVAKVVKQGKSKKVPVVNTVLLARIVLFLVTTPLTTLFSISMSTTSSSKS